MKQREILLIISSFFALVLLYFGFSLYHNYVTSTIPEDLNIQITPISPTFDSKALSDIKKRESVLPLYQTGQTELIEVSTSSATTSGETQ